MDLVKDKKNNTSKDVIADKIEKKRHREQYVVEQMITIYCHHNHGTKKQDVCPECKELLEYSKSRSAHCPFMEKKTFCSNCKVHCYKPEMREKIRAVMRYSGPRILFYHPIMATWHVISSRIEKNKIKNKK